MNLPCPDDGAGIGADEPLHRVHFVPAKGLFRVATAPLPIPAQPLERFSLHALLGDPEAPACAPVTY
jgi:hypothetical protein